jgi:hypothetical protein
MKKLFAAAGALFFVSTSATAQSNAARADSLKGVPDLTHIIAQAPNELANVVSRYQADAFAMMRRYDASGSPEQRRRMSEWYAGWDARVTGLDFERLSSEAKVDWVLLDNEIDHERKLLARGEKQRVEMQGLVPFADRLLMLQDRRRNLVTIDSRAAAATVAAVTRQVDSLRKAYDSRPAAGAASRAPQVSRTVANRAARAVDEMRSVTSNWFRYYNGYDPMFSWWMKDPYTKLDEALNSYAKTLREKVIGIPPGQGGANDGPIIGDPIGADGLAEELEFEMIDYTPAELIAIAEREYAFSLSEMKKASREMGFGDNWKAAMEKVKDTWVEPGKQIDLIRDLEREAIEFFDRHDWVTIPELAREDWRMEMMSPERQRIAPFFLGGESIIVSYPTSEMTDEEKVMSLRGNNPHFSRAVVFHELNPGHHLQGFMAARYNPHRRLFSTPFWNEGQALYWEMFLWDNGFQKKPEDRIGALFWRMHRSARIIFSLSFHTGKMTPEQAIQFLVDTVNFERANAEGEVRRSFSGDYGPLYQMAYMIGGLQLRALHRELVESGRMTNRQFHDAVLQGGPMPIAMVRARLAGIPLTRQGPPRWRFADSLPPPKPL